MENFLTTISDLIRDKELPALMIGGHAVTALGHPRATYDLDLHIPRSSVAVWKSELSRLSYSPYAKTANFIQFEPHPGFPLPPVDLMLVNDRVFESLGSRKNDSMPIPTPDVVSMIALNLHAINQPSRRETSRDWDDILALVEVHKLTLDDPDFFAIVSKHGREKATERIKATISGGD